MSCITEKKFLSLFVVMATKSANQKKQTLYKASAFFGIIQFVVWAADCIIFQTDSMLWRI